MLALTTGMQLWLSWRHSRHVANNRGTVPVRFEATISLADHAKAADYTIAKQALFRVESLVGALLVLALTLGGVLQACSNVAVRFADSGSLSHGILLFGMFGLVSLIVDQPFSIFRTFILEKRFGFNHMDPQLYLADLAKQLLLALVLGAPLLLAALWLVQRMGSHWWLWVWLLWSTFNLLALVLYPMLIAPLFNKFEPLEDMSLRRRIESLLARCGFRAKGLLVMDGSRRSAHGNAYFTGFGAARRIVFFDTLLKSLSESEIEAVLAHELGHFHHHHLWKRFLFISLASLLLL